MTEREYVIERCVFVCVRERERERERERVCVCVFYLALSAIYF